MRIRSFLFLSIILYLIGCDDKTNHIQDIDVPDEPAKDVVIEIRQEKERYRYVASIQDKENEEFLNGSQIQNIPSKIRLMRVLATQEGDTIKSADEIPTFTSEIINQKIYSDGSYRFVTTNTTPNDSNVFRVLNFNPPHQDEDVSKTVVQNGVITLYNNKGQQMYSEKIKDIDCTWMLDSLKAYIASKDQMDNSKNSESNKLQRVAQLIQETENSGMKFVYRTSDEIVFEKIFDNYQDLQAETKSNRRILVMYSSDMQVIRSQKIYENNQLHQVITYEYNNSKNTNHKFIVPHLLKEELKYNDIKSVTSRNLCFSNKGVPYVLVSEENVKSNELTINL